MSSRHRAADPNVLVIVLDSVRRDHMSCYGYERPTTPNIDRFAEEAVLFRHAYSTSCWTIPAHASLFTGLYPSRHGANDLREDCLADDHTTMASFLGTRGYRTASISCNSFLSGPTHLDRDFQLSLDVQRLRGSSRGLPSRVLRGMHRRWRKLAARDRGGMRATRLASSWLGEQEPGRPFFLFMNYMDCHLPYRLRGPDRYRFVPKGERRRADEVPQDPFGFMVGATPLDGRALSDLENLYDGALHYLDRHVGALLERLRSADLYDNTLIVVTADHGESFGEHGLMDHQFGLYEHLIAVPLLLHLPGSEKQGEGHVEPVQHVDLLPTLAGLLGGGSENGTSAAFQGRSVLEQPPREAVVAEYLVPNLRAIRRRFPAADAARFDAALRSILVEGSKLILRSDGGRELYDLEIDPHEKRNLAEHQPELADRLEKKLFSIVGDWPVMSPSESPPGLDELADRLRHLGYL